MLRRSPGLQQGIAEAGSSCFTNCCLVRPARAVLRAWRASPSKIFSTPGAALVPRDPLAHADGRLEVAVVVPSAFALCALTSCARAPCSC